MVNVDDPRGRQLAADPQIPLTTFSARGAAGGGAFRRRAGADEALVAVARFPGRREASGFDAETTLVLPEGRWTDALTGQSFAGGAVGLGALFGVIPAAVLMRRS